MDTSTGLRGGVLWVLLLAPAIPAVADDHLNSLSTVVRREAPSSFDPVAWAKAANRLTDGHGLGTAASGSAIAGAGSFLEAVKFGDGVHLYCGPTAGVTSDLQVSLSGYKVTAVGQCDGEKYTGGFLTLGGSVTFEGVEVGATASASLGVDPVALPGALKNIRAKLRRAEPLLRKRPPPGLLASTGSESRVGAALLVSSSLSLTQKDPIQPETTIWEALGKGLARELLDHPDILLGRRSLSDALKSAVAELKVMAKDPDRSPDEREWADLLAAVGDDLIPVLTGCDSVTGGATVGLGAIPISGSLSYSHYSRIGTLSPLDPIGSAATLATLGSMATPVVGSLVTGKICLQPASETIAAITQALSE